MNITLDSRTAVHVSTYWKRTQDAEIKAMLPSSAKTEEQALRMFEDSLRPDATSYGRIILIDDEYVGDIWCYCIDEAEEKSAMLSYCIFEKQYWNKGIATEAVKLFLQDVFQRYQIQRVGAFTYANNRASIRVLEKAGFHWMENWAEDSILSCYYEIEK